MMLKVMVVFLGKRFGMFVLITAPPSSPLPCPCPSIATLLSLMHFSCSHMIGFSLEHNSPL